MGREYVATHAMFAAGTQAAGAPPRLPEFGASGGSEVWGPSVSFGLSLDPSEIELERTVRSLTVFVALFAATSLAADRTLAASLAPPSSTLPESDAPGPETSVRAAARIDEARSIAEILRMLDEDPIEGGVTHAAQPVFAVHLSIHGSDGLVGVVRTIEPAFRAAALLRLAGRSSDLGPVARVELVTWGLGSSSVEVRDATIQAIENWEDPTLAARLAEHRDPVEWLAAYSRTVVRDLGG